MHLKNFLSDFLRSHLGKKSHVSFVIQKFRQACSQEDHEKYLGSVKELGRSLGNVCTAWIWSAGFDEIREIGIFALQLLRNYHTKTWKWQSDSQAKCNFAWISIMQNDQCLCMEWKFTCWELNRRQRKTKSMSSSFILILPFHWQQKFSIKWKKKITA